jgi:taurine dioxygenase
MDIRLHENGWTVFLENFDFSQVTQEEINVIGNLLATNIIVIARKQKLTPQDERRILHMFGEVDSHLPLEHEEPWKYFFIPGTGAELIRVTGGLDDHGHPGMFHHVSDLDWHCNQPAHPWRKPIVWLYGIEGTKGSRTSWNNTVMAFDDLSPEYYDEIKDLKMICGFKQGNYTEISFGKSEDFNEHYNPSVIHTNDVNGKKCIFFPFLQFKHFVGMTKEETLPILEKLRDYILQEKYIYHHDWEDGDVVISEQWQSLHKRWAFDKIADRLLHRGVCDFANIKFNK